MGAAAFGQVDKTFQGFHAYFAPLFGRRKTRDHGRHCLQALLVQSGKRHNAEKLSEPVPASARVLRRFLAESTWDDVIGRRQEYLGPRSGPMEAVSVLDWADFPRRSECARLGRLPQAGTEVREGGPSALRETGRGGQLPRRNVPGLCQPVGTGPGGQTNVSAGELDPGQRPV